MIRAILCVALAALAGCASPQPPPADFGGKLFTQTRLRTAAPGNDMILYYNPPNFRGETIKPGTPVTIVSISGKAIAFRLESGLQLELYADKGVPWNLASAPTWLPKFFGRAPPAVAPELEHRAAHGVVEPGDSKEDVALIAGWPSHLGQHDPAGNLPKDAVLRSDAWFYRTSNWGTANGLIFRDGKLQAPPPAAAEGAETKH